MSLPPTIIAQVQHNCLISDARSAGDYSVCGLALRLRDLYKWEHQLPPWQEGDPQAVLAWIDAQEQRWEQSGELEFNRLELTEGVYDPFATQAINRALKPHRLAYAAGYGPFLNPSFLLGKLERQYRMGGVRVIEFGTELARDLLAIPAFSDETTVYLRRAAMHTAIWDEIFYLRPSAKPALEFGLAAFKIENSHAQIRIHLTRLVDRMHPLYLKHELSEVTETALDRNQWREMVAAHPRTTVELLARTFKDTLANTSDQGPLAHIYEQRDAGLFGLWMAFQPHLPLTLFPRLPESFEQFQKDGDWEGLDAARRDIRHQAQGQTERLIEFYQQGKNSGDPQRTEALVQKHLLPNS